MTYSLKKKIAHGSPAPSLFSTSGSQNPGGMLESSSRHLLWPKNSKQSSRVVYRRLCLQEPWPNSLLTQASVFLKAPPIPRRGRRKRACYEQRRMSCLPHSVMRNGKPSHTDRLRPSGFLMQRLYKFFPAQFRAFVHPRPYVMTVGDYP